MYTYQINFTDDESVVINYHIVKALNIQNAWRYAVYALHDDACFNIRMNSSELAQYFEFINSGQYEKAVMFYVGLDRSDIKEVEVTAFEIGNANIYTYMCQNCGDIVNDPAPYLGCRVCNECHSTQINKLP